MKTKFDGHAEAVCVTHVSWVVSALAGDRAFRIMVVSGRPEGGAKYTCHCGQPADFYFREMTDD